jgi:kynurenine formamidase
LDNFYLQASTQWDALRHIAAREFGYYNGVSHADAGPDGDRLGIDAWAAHGIVGRGVLVDVARHVNQTRGEPLDPFEGFWITAELLDQILSEQGSTLREGDILLLRTGYTNAIRDDGSADRPRSWPGLAPEESMASYLWDKGVAAVVADNPAVETAPGDPKAFLHRRLIPMLGMALGEFFDLELLAEDCAEDGRYTCFFASAPLNLPRGVGSPGNAICLK